MSRLDTPRWARAIGVDGIFGFASAEGWSARGQGGRRRCWLFFSGFEPSEERRITSAELVGGRRRAWFGRVGLEALDWWRSWQRFCGVSGPRTLKEC